MVHGLEEWQWRRGQDDLRNLFLNPRDLLMDKVGSRGRCGKGRED